MLTHVNLAVDGLLDRVGLVLAGTKGACALVNDVVSLLLELFWVLALELFFGLFLEVIHS
jgi:hypothetical protein